MAKLNPTLLLSLVLALVASSNANGPHRRDHADLGRLMKKRAPIDVLGDQSSMQTVSSSPAQSSQASSATAQATSASSVSVQTTPEPASASASANPSTASGGLLGSVVGGLLPTESSATSSSVPSASSPSSHSSSTAQASAQPSNVPAENPTQSTPRSILYLTASNAPTPTQTSSTSTSSSGMSHAAMTVLVVIAASAGAAVIAWTVIRKWKFRPSSDFEGRMQPIDWQPGGSNEDPGLSGQRSLSRASSFHSGGQTDGQIGGHGGEYGGSTLEPILDHDFTAGPAHLAPVGGYADLARGPSPQPMMQESLGRSPSFNRPVQYDQYGVPLHHGYSGY